MGSDLKGVGTIIVVCKSCGAKLYHYAIGDSGNRNKFNGPPTPAKATSGFDGGLCPICERRLSAKPYMVVFMSHRKFELTYIMGKYKLIVRESLGEYLSSASDGVRLREELAEG